MINPSAHCLKILTRLGKFQSAGLFENVMVIFHSGRLFSSLVMAATLGYLDLRREDTKAFQGLGQKM